MTDRVDRPSIHRIAPWRVFLATFIWPMGCVGLVSVLFWRLSSELPDPLASHWGPSGPDGSMSRAAFFSLPVGVGALIATTGLVVALATSHFVAERVAMVAGSGVATFFAGMALTSLLANRGAATWSEATPLGAGSVGAVVAAALLVGAVAWRLAGRAPAVPEDQSPWQSVRSSPERGVASDGPPDWDGGCRVQWPLWLAAALAVIVLTAVLAAPQAPGRVLIGAAGVLSVLACATTSRVSLRVDAQRVTLRFGAVGLPTRHLSASEIDAVEVIDLDPLQWGGWGYRWVPHRHATAVVLRRGEAVVFHLAGGRILAITVDDAAGCAAAVAALIRSHRPPR